jgi:predicted nucleotidyltransferase
MNKLETFINSRQLEAFCQRWKIQELALFGSALRDDFGLESDIDLLVSFESDADWSLLEHVQMQLELQELFGRKVDLVNKRALKQSENWIRRDEILQTALPIFMKNEVVHGTGGSFFVGYCSCCTLNTRVLSGHDKNSIPR